MADPSAPLPSLAPSGSALPPAAPPAAPAIPFTDAQVDEFREQDRWLPIANVARIMKNSLPRTAKISKEAKECVQECVSEFISFITSEAAEKCTTEKRKTINGEDILISMRALGFDNYEGVLKVYLAKYRDHLAQQSAQRTHKQAATGYAPELAPGDKREAERGGADELVRKRAKGPVQKARK
ncbi:transcriptional activator hap3 [Cryptotrichosporon argae]